MAKLFHKAYSNGKIIYPSIGNKVSPEKLRKIKYLRVFLKRYQSFYKNTGKIIIIPKGVDEYLKYLKGNFNIEKDNIENMLKVIERHI